MKAIHIYSIIGMLIIALSISGCMMSEKTEIPTQDVIETPITIETPATIVLPVVIETPQEIEVVSSIPDDYYNITVDQHFIDHGLYGYLKGYHWDKPVWTDSWSMSETAELEQILTNRGCNVTIRLAMLDTSLSYGDEDWFPSKYSDDYERSCYNDSLNQYSSWLMIELDDKMVAYCAASCIWIFEPDHPDKGVHWKGDKLYDNSAYKVGEQWIGPYSSATITEFIDFEDIYELEDWYLSGEANEKWLEGSSGGKWFNYFRSDQYNTTDDFLSAHGWWLSEKEYREINTRINKATGWYGYGVDY
jgi:hypothetical protein